MLLPVFSPSFENLFAVTPYTGNGGTQSIVTGQNLSGGSALWVKATNNTQDHVLVDTVRGAGNGLYPNLTNAEDGSSGVSAFNGSGFSVTGGNLSNNTWTYTAFSWLEQAGYMDIVTYTGDGSARTIAHNLVATPQLMIVKKRSGTDGWRIYHVSQGATKYGQFTTAAFTTSSNEWNDTAPTSSVFSLGTSNNVNQNTATYVAYLFAEKAGKSKFGSYTGTGATNSITGLGFAPKMVIIKCTSDVTNWQLFYDVQTTPILLIPNDTDAAVSGGFSRLSGLSDGFRLDNSNGVTNASGRTYIYAAWG